MDIVANISPALDVGVYVKNTLKDALNLSINDLTLKVRNIEKLMAKFSCDADTAYYLHCLSRNEYEVFPSITVFNSVMEFANKRSFIHEKETLLMVYDQMIQTNQWPYTNDVNALVKKIYQHCPPEKQTAIIVHFLSHINKIVTVTRQDNFIAELKNKLPFPWMHFVSLLIRKPDQLAALESIFNEEIVAVLTLEIILSGIIEDFANQGVYLERLKAMMTKFLSLKKISDLTKYLTYIYTRIPTLQKWFNDQVLIPYFALPSPNEVPLKERLKHLTILPLGRDRTVCLETLIISNVNFPFFLDVYARFSSGQAALFTELEQQFAHKAEIQPFFMAKDMLIFQNAKNPSLAQIIDFFHNYFVTGRDKKGIFKAQVEGHLKTLPFAKKVQNGLEIYELIEMMKDGQPDVIDIIFIIEKHLYSASFVELGNFINRQQYNKLVSIYNRLKDNANRDLILLRTYMLFSLKLGTEQLVQAYAQSKLYSFLSPKQIVQFFQTDAKVVISAYFHVRNKPQIDIFTRLDALLTVPIHNINRLELVWDL